MLQLRLPVNVCLEMAVDAGHAATDAVCVLMCVCVHLSLPKYVYNLVLQVLYV